MAKDCALCKKKLGKECMICDLCDRHICITCLAIDKNLFNLLNEETTNSASLMTICHQCRNDAFRHIKTEIKLKTKNNEAAKKFDEMIEKVEQISTNVQNNLEKIGNLVQLNDNIKSYSDVLKTEPDKIKGAVKLAILENRKEEEIREKEDKISSSVVLYNMPATDIEDDDERKQMDTSKAEDFIKEGVKITRNMEIKHVNRIGKFDPQNRDRPRPLRVVFENKIALARLFKNIGNLREAEAKHKHIGVQRELNDEQLKCYKDKVNEANNRNKENKDDSKFYVVRGPPDNMEIKMVNSTKPRANPNGQK